MIGPVFIQPIFEGINRISLYHTHPFNGPLSRTTRVSRYQKGKTNLDFTEARDSEWQWHQLGHMQICTLLLTDSHATPHHSVFAGRMPFQPPNQQCQSTEGIISLYIVYVKVRCRVRPSVCPYIRPLHAAATGLLLSAGGQEISIDCCLAGTQQHGAQQQVRAVRYDTRCYFNVRSKADMSQLNLPHGTNN